MTFTSNDYLGLAQNAHLADIATNTLKDVGMGSAGSRLLGGDTTLAHTLEATLAMALGTESALVWASGYQTNVGILSVLADRQDIVFADRYIHASWVDGVRLAGTRIQRFRHNDMAHLESLLQRYRGSCRRAIVVVESLYSMDGDVAPLAELFRLKEQYDTLLVIDEAHAFGVAGPQGLGYTDVYLSPHAHPRADLRGGSPLGQGNPDPSSSAGANGIERADDVYVSPHAHPRADLRGGSPLGQGNPDPSSAAGANGIERADDVYLSPHARPKADLRGGSPLGQGNPDPSSAAGAGIERAEPFQSHQKTPVPAFAGTGVFIVGTFGKACGSYGAFVACEAHWRQEFIQSARSFIYSTGLPLPVLAWNLAVVSQLGSYAALREKLWAQVAYFRDKIRTLSPLGSCMIVPVLCDETRAEPVVTALREAGFWVACVRYPTVPKGQSRLRLSLCADHSEAALSALAAQLLSLLPVQDG